MSGLLPNPPSKVDPALTLRQNYFNWQIAPMPGATQLAILANGGWAAPQLNGNAFFPLSDLTNNITRLPRKAMQALAGGANDVGFYAPVTLNLTEYGAWFPGAAGDGGYQLEMICGLDATLSTLATTSMLLGVHYDGNQTPSVGDAMTNALTAWFGMYTDQTGDLRFGYKQVGGAIVRLDNGEIPAGTYWQPYQGFKFNVTFSPVGPMTYYTLSALTTANLWTVLLNGSTNAFNPGRVWLGPNFGARKNTAGDVLQLWFMSAWMRAYPFGSLSI